MTRTAAIVGTGLTEWDTQQATFKDLVQEAGKETFDDVDDLGPDDVEGLFVGPSSRSGSPFRATVPRWSPSSSGFTPAG